MEKEGKCLVKRHAFGARGDVKGSLAWLDEGTLMYPVGKAVALHNVTTNNQRFLEASYQSAGVTALAVSANKKFIAVAEAGENPQIQIIDTTTRKRRKVLTVPDLGSDRFTSLAFSTDGRHLVTQGGAPSWNLFYWNWERSKPLASVSIASAADPEQNRGGNSAHNNAGGSAMATGQGAAGSTAAITSLSSPHGPLVTNVAICPGDALTITVSGVGLLRFYKYTDGFLQPQPSCGYPREQQDVFLAHTWLDAERLVASTKRNGALVLLERGRYVGQLTKLRRVGNVRHYTSAMGSGAGAAEDAAAVSAIIATRNGFVTGGSNGAISVYERNPMATGAAPKAEPRRPGNAHAGSGGGGEEGDNSDEDDGAATGLYDCLCTLSVPEREPGEPADLTLRRDPNSSPTAAAPAGAAGTGVGRKLDRSTPGLLTGDMGTATSALGESSGLTMAAKTRSEKPRRFRVTASTAATREGGPRTTAIAVAGGDEEARPSWGHDGQHEEGMRGGGAGAVGASAAAVATGPATLGGAPVSVVAVQEAAGALLGTTLNRLGHGVASLALDQGEETLAVLTNAGKVYALDFRQHWAQVQRELDSQRAKQGASATAGRNTPLPMTRGPEQDATEASASGAAAAAATTATVAGLTTVPSFEPVCGPFHTGRINGMSCSVRKAFLLTSSSDHSVRLWNTSTHKMEMCVFFKEEPHSVALHPSGLMAIICFPDCVRVMSVLWNSLRDRRVINFRHASDVAFSHGGQFFSISHGNLVDIFRSTTCEPHGQLRGHLQKVKDLKWCSNSPYPTDNSLITCSLDGMIMYWSSPDARKEAEHSDNKRYQYLAVAADDRYVWALGAPTTAMTLEVQWKVTLREMDRHVLGSLNASSDDYEFTDTALTSLLVASHQRMLFGGGEDGSLKVMSLPLPVGVQAAPLPAHAARITCMAVSHDQSTLFTAGADGSIFVWEIREDANRAAANGAAATTGGVMAGAGRLGGGTDNFQYGTNEVLVTQQELEEHKTQMESLQQTVEKLKAEIDGEEKRRNHEQGTRMRERMEEFRGDAATLASEYAAVWNSKAEQARAFAAIKLEKEAEAAREMEQTETTHQAEVHELEEMCNNLQYTLENEEAQHVQELLALQERIEEEAQADQDRYQDLISQRKEVLEKLTRQVERARQTNQETLHQLELDTDAETQEVGGKHQRELNVLRERFLHMKGEGAIMRKNAARMEREIDVRSGELRLLDSAKAALATQLAELSQRMSQLHQDIDERDAVIGEKEKAIYGLKKQNQELEKYKFVLDHRIRQLKAQMEPKQREILRQNQLIKSRNSELESLHEGNLTLRASIESLKTDLSTQQQLIKQLLRDIKGFETYKTRYLRDMGEIAPSLQEPLQLREVVAKLYKTHVASRGGARVAAADPQIRQEFQEQLEYLSSSVEALRRKVKADQTRHKEEVSAMMTENLGLIKEIHALRAEIQELRTMVAAEEATRRARGSLSASAPATGTRRREFPKQSVRSSGHEDGDGDREANRATVTTPTTAGTADGAKAAARGPSLSTSSSSSPPTAADGAGGVGGSGGKAALRKAVNPMSSASAPHPHPHPPTSTRAASTVGSMSATQEARRRQGMGPRRSVGPAGAGGDTNRVSEPPKLLEENRAELRALRAYIELLERTKAEAQRPGSVSGSSKGVPRLPPLNAASVGEPQEQQ